jgi:hypothetical protein
MNLLFGDSVAVPMADRKSLLSLCRSLQNHRLEMVVFSASIGESSQKALDIFETERMFLAIDPAKVYLYFDRDLCLLSVENLFEVFSSGSLVVRTEDWLLDFIFSLGESGHLLLDCVRYEFLSDESISKFCEGIDLCQITPSIWKGLCQRLKNVGNPSLSSGRHCSKPGFLDSQIVTALPSPLSMFRTKDMALLYRGSRDGLDVRSFHGRCDGTGRTITIIESDRGYILGGYTPLAWDSTGNWKADTSLQSFIFTVKNPTNTGARPFPLKSGCAQYAIHCAPSYGPNFGGTSDLCVSFSASASASVVTNLGNAYNNDTGHPGNSFLAGVSSSAIRELEVFAVSG